MRIIETIVRLLLLWLFLVFLLSLSILITLFLEGLSELYGYFIFRSLPPLFFPLALTTLVFYMFFVKLRYNSSLAASLIGAFSSFFIISILIQCFDSNQVSPFLIGIREFKITDSIHVLHIFPLFAGFTMYFLGGFLLKKRSFKKGVSRFMKIFFSTLLWMVVFEFYTFLVFCEPVFKEGTVEKAQEDAKEWFDPLTKFMWFYLYMFLFFLWQFWILVWGHYYLVVKKIKNTWMYYTTSILYILTLWAFSMIIELHIFPKVILEFRKEHSVPFYILVYVLTAFLLAFLQRCQFKDRLKQKRLSNDLG